MIENEIKSEKENFDFLARKLISLSAKIGSDKLTETLQNIQDRIQDPFMFVIVGEVKAGKSSFINALLGEADICKVAPSPMTDTIQQIIYDDIERQEVVNPYLKKIYKPIPILNEIAIVDTPGTNTIIDHHQEVTEHFIPVSDLIVFVFEAKNPYRESAWKFFNFISSDWHKKVIFILQQKDLMSTEDLTINEEGVRSYAIKKGISQPDIFSVSAKMELEGIAHSGFESVRSYITNNVTGGKAPLLKLESNLKALEQIHIRIGEGVVVRKNQLDSDIAFRRDIAESLDIEEKKTERYIDILVENLVAEYSTVTSSMERSLEDGLGFGVLLKKSLNSIFSKSESPKEWLNSLSTKLEENLNTRLKEKLAHGIYDIAENVQQMVKIIDLKIRNSETILKDDHEFFADIAEKRANVLKELQQSFDQFLASSESFTDPKLFTDHNPLSSNLATGGGIAAIGMILTTLVNGAVFDITGGILTTIGILFAGVSVSLQRKKIIRGFRNEIASGKEKLQSSVRNILTNYISNLKAKIIVNFTKFDHLIDQEKSQLDEIKGSSDQIAKGLQEMLDRLAVKLKSLS